MILRHITENAGVTASSLLRKFGGAWGGLQYHLGRLMHAELVDRIKVGRETAYFAAGTSGDRVRRMALAAQPSKRRILALLGERSPLRLVDICRALGMTRKTGIKHLRELQDAEMVREERGLHVVRYAPAAAADPSLGKTRG